MQKQLLISTGKLTRETLKGQVAIVTGGGQGIGFETVRALAWLGAQVIIAEIDAKVGKTAAFQINQEMGEDTVTFIHTDVAKEHSVKRLARQALREFGRVDIVLNNATAAPMGSILESSLAHWDLSYQVNLRGPLHMAQAFLPAMLARDNGTFICVTSEGLAFMGPYETMKAAQAHLARTIDAELEGSGVVAFSIGPGLVKTQTASAAIERLAPLYGKTTEEFYAMNQAHILTVEAAGAAFAAAIALAPEFRGQEIGSLQALLAAGINLSQERELTELHLDEAELKQAQQLCRDVLTTLREQYNGWLERSIFERQWLFRDFKKHAGMPAEQWLETLEKLSMYLESSDLTAIANLYAPVSKLADFYAHLQDLAKGYVKDPAELAQNLSIVQGWENTAMNLALLLNNSI